MAGTLDKYLAKYGNTGSYQSHRENTAQQSEYQAPEKKRKGTLDAYMEKYGQAHRDYFTEQFGSRMNQFSTGMDQIMTQMQADSGNLGFRTASDMFSRYSSSAQSLRKQAEQLEAFLYGNRQNISEEDYRKYSDYLRTSVENMNRQVDTIGDASRVYGLFKDEDEFNRWASGEPDNRQGTYETDSKAEDIAALEREIMDKQRALDEYAPDYDWTDANQRKQVTDEIDRRTTELDDLKDTVTSARYKDMISSLSEQERKALEDSNGKDSSMAYGYLLQKGYSREDINAMYETMKREKTAEVSDKTLEAVYDKTGKNVGTAAAGFAGSRAGNLAGAVTGTFQTVHDTAKHYLQGSPYQGTDPNALGYLPSRMAGAADQAVSDAIEGENGGILRKGAAFVYRGAANAADNLARMAVSSAIGGPALGAGVTGPSQFGAALTRCRLKDDTQQ